MRLRDTARHRAPATAAAEISPVVYNDAGESIDWRKSAILGPYIQGFFESPAALQALSGRERLHPAQHRF